MQHRGIEIEEKYCTAALERLAPPRGPKPTFDHNLVQNLLENTDLDFQGIAERVGVTRERVRVIALRFGVTGRKRRESLRLKLVTECANRREAEDTAIFTAWVENGKCDNLRVSRAINRYLSWTGFKRCCACNLPKPIAQFSTRGPLKHSSRCKKCTAKSSNVCYHHKRVKRSNSYIPPTDNHSQTGVTL